jgi:hypothetical protein
VRIFWGRSIALRSMIEPDTQRIHGGGKADSSHSKIYEVLRIDTGAGGFVFAARVFLGRRANF